MTTETNFSFMAACNTKKNAFLKSIYAYNYFRKQSSELITLWVKLLLSQKPHLLEYLHVNNTGMDLRSLPDRNMRYTYSLFRLLQNSQPLI